MQTKKMTRRKFIKTTGTVAVMGMFGIKADAVKKKQPNIIIIYADDLGYGDVSCYGAKQINTPNIDKLASNGLRFTNAYAPSATCTPSRYAMLTGEYAWRKKGTGIARGDAKMIIEPGRTSLATVMQKAGYNTAVIGKWHLGLGDGNMDWNKSVTPGPESIDFDHSFIIPATNDRVPCVYVQDGQIVGLDPNDPIEVNYEHKIGNEPTGRENPELLEMKGDNQHSSTIVNGIGRIGWMKGGKSARWEDEEIADVITAEAIDYIKDNKDENFFLYFSTIDIHTPRAPHPRFTGKSKLGIRGDVIMQLDWCVGQITRTLEELNLIDDTIVIFTSDNGPVLHDGYEDQAVELAKEYNHKPAGPLRGGKYSAFDGGTRVPFIVHWPGNVKPGQSDALVCQIDFKSSFAKLTGQKLSDDVAPDSFDVLDALLGKSKNARDHLIQQSVFDTLSIINGKWKYIEPSNKRKKAWDTGIESGNDPDPQLYNLKSDIGEKNNVAEKHPEMVKKLQQQLEELKSKGRSRP